MAEDILLIMQLIHLMTSISDQILFKSNIINKNEDHNINIYIWINCTVQIVQYYDWLHKWTKTPWIVGLSLFV